MFHSFFFHFELVLSENKNLVKHNVSSILAKREILNGKGPNWKKKKKKGAHWNDAITFLKFDFVVISLKKHNLAKSRNFRSLKLKV